MPRGDGTGPVGGGGPGTGRGRQGTGQGFGKMRGTQAGAGPSGECVCSGCGNKVPHKVGTPCYNVTCPKCGAVMTRA